MTFSIIYKAKTHIQAFFSVTATSLSLTTLNAILPDLHHFRIRYEDYSPSLSIRPY